MTLPTDITTNLTEHPGVARLGRGLAALMDSQPVAAAFSETASKWLGFSPLPAARKSRRPTLANVAKQASKAAIPVARYEVKPDGTIVVVTGESEPAKSENPWLAELPKETKQ